MSSRDAILRAVRAARPAASALPDVRQVAQGFSPPPGDPAALFADAAVAGGARVVEGGAAQLPRLVSQACPGAVRVLSLVAAVPGTVSPPPDPHELAELEVLVCEGVLGVAENGAVWLPESRVGSRAALFLAAHVVVVLDRAAIVSDFHEAYARMDAAGEGFGAFVAGPSKTADIEQSLVVGAHGPRGLTVILTS